MNRPSDEALVPVTAYLHGSTFMHFEKLARQRDTTVGVLIGVTADAAAAYVPPKPKRRYRYVTDAEIAEIASLAKLGTTPRSIAHRLGISESSVRNHFPKADR